MSLPASHALVPKIVFASEDEVSETLSRHGATKDNLPLIKADDAGLKLNGIEAKPGDVVKCVRPSPMTGKDEAFFRRVVE